MQVQLHSMVMNVSNLQVLYFILTKSKISDAVGQLHMCQVLFQNFRGGRNVDCGLHKVQLRPLFSIIIIIYIKKYGSKCLPMILKTLLV